MVPTTTWGSWIRSQSIPDWLVILQEVERMTPTLFAGLVLSFSNIFCDWAFDANAIAAQLLY